MLYGKNIEYNIKLYSEDEYISEMVELLTNTECDDFEELWEM